MTMLVRVLMIVLCMNLVLYAGGVQVIENENFLNRFVDLDDDGEVRDVSDGLRDTAPDEFDTTGDATGILSFVDALGIVRDFIFFMINIIFAPIGLFIGTGMPNVVVMLVGIPLMVSGFVGIMYFVRAGN